MSMPEQHKNRPRCKKCGPKNRMYARMKREHGRKVEAQRMLDRAMVILRELDHTDGLPVWARSTVEGLRLYREQTNA